MIPPHAGAILMCEKASIQDPEIKRAMQKYYLKPAAGD
jgi:hypothetical protein